MKIEEATMILRALIDGCDPRTGEELPPSSVIHYGVVMQALGVALLLLEERCERNRTRLHFPLART